MKILFCILFDDTVDDDRGYGDDYDDDDGDDGC